MIKTNYKLILNIMTIAMLIYGVFMIPSVLMCIRYKEYSCGKMMFIISVVCIVIGLLFKKFLDQDITNVKKSVSYFITIATWMLLIILSALPFYVSGERYSFVNSIFESAAGWSTTGAKVIESSSLPVGLQLWRATCNWLGGIGIIMITLVFLPNWRFLGQTLVHPEIRGPKFIKDATTFRDALRRILIVYVFFTLIQSILLCLAGMRPFHSLLTAMTVISSSGLLHLGQNSIVGYSPLIQTIITVFSFLSAINVAFVVLISIGKYKRAFRMTEVKAYFIIITISTAIISISTLISNGGSHKLSIIGQSLSQLISFSSTSGYITTDAQSWNPLCTTILLFVSIIGGCAVSTSGGIKIVRLICMSKMIHFGLFKHLHPRSVRALSYNKVSIKPHFVHQTNLYIMVFFMTFLFGSLLLSLDNITITEAMNTSMAMLTTTGTSISDLSGNASYASYSSFSKIVMSLLMIGGRLEIYPLLVLFFKSFWVQDSNA